MVSLIDTPRFTLRVSLALPLVWMAAMVTGRTALFALTFSLVTLHELAHAAALALFHFPVNRIDLRPYGAELVSESEPEQSPGAEAAMAFAGPLLNLGLACAASFALNRGWTWPHGVLFLRINLALACLNLVPALPLDGGHILRAALSRHLGLGRACRITAWVSVACAVGFLGLGVACALAHAFQPLFFFLPLRMLLAARESACAAAWMGLREAEVKRAELSSRGLLPLRHVALDENTRLSALLPRLAPRSYHLFTVIDGQGDPLGNFSEEILLRALRTRRAVTAGEVLAGTVAAGTNLC